MEESTRTSSPSLMDLPDVVQFCVWQFLDADTVCGRLTCVNQRYRDLLVGTQRQCDNMATIGSTSNSVEMAVWKPICRRLWPWLPRSDLDVTPRMTSCSAQLRPRASPDYATLLPLATASDALTSQMDLPDIHPAYVDIVRPTSRRHRATVPPLFTRSPSDSSILQFTGNVGMGNRCLVSQAPLPRPVSLTTATPKRSIAWTRLTNALRAANRHATRRSRRLSERHRQIVWKPLILPFYARTADGTTVLDVSPRLVSYFEVSILPHPANETMNEELGCVAVGLATEHFRGVHDRIMPGWDRHSFGYHGDDGGFYHGSGGMMALPRNGEHGDDGTLSHFPRFGAPGDVVGCGVDYHRHVMFYTLNGRALGAAFDLRDTAMIHTPLYAVVGVDTNRPIRCNYGTEPDHPFVFDLQGRIRNDADILVPTVREAMEKMNEAARGQAQSSPKRRARQSVERLAHSAAARLSRRRRVDV